MTRYNPDRLMNVAYILRELESSTDGHMMPDHVQLEDRNDGEIRLVYTPQESDE